MSEQEEKDYSHLNHLNDDIDFEGALWDHFDNLKMNHWVDVGREGTAIYDSTFWEGEDKIEDDSPLQQFIQAIALAGFHAALKSVSDIQGISEEKLMEQIDEYWGKQ